MKPFTDLLLYLAVGMVLFFIHYALRGRLPSAFRVFFILGSFALGAYYAVGTMQALGLAIPGWIATILEWAVHASELVLGYCLGYMMGGVGRHYSYIIRGLSIQIGITFVAFSIGKSLNLPEMKQFFLSSGYSVSFLYFIIVLEGAAGMVLFFNLKYYARLVTLAILSAILIGAIVTHARNGDPVGDSVDAILLGTKMVLLVTLFIRPGVFYYLCPPMGQKKLIRFEAIKSFPNVLQYPEGMAGQWAKFYKNDHPLTLELACGKGEYTVGLAGMYPHRNFLGVDMKGNRIYIGAKKSIQENITNAAFLRTHIDKIATYFDKGEVAEIWLTFPDPQLRKSRFTRRLTHPKFIRLYQQILKPGGCIHLKTDSPVLYQFTKWVIDMYHLTLLEDSDHVHAEPDSIKDELKINTHYEKLDIAQSGRIHYLSFSLPEQPLPTDQDAALHEKVKNEEPTPPERVRPPRVSPHTPQ